MVLQLIKKILFHNFPQVICVGRVIMQKVISLTVTIVVIKLAHWHSGTWCHSHRRGGQVCVLVFQFAVQSQALLVLVVGEQRSDGESFLKCPFSFNRLPVVFGDITPWYKALSFLIPTCFRDLSILYPSPMSVKKCCVLIIPSSSVWSDMNKECTGCNSTRRRDTSACQLK